MGKKCYDLIVRSKRQVSNLVESFSGIVKNAQVGADATELKGRSACEHLGTEVHANKLVSPTRFRPTVKNRAKAH